MQIPTQAPNLTPEQRTAIEAVTVKKARDTRKYSVHFTEAQLAQFKADPKYAGVRIEVANPTSKAVPA